jgi:hypothetical protein
MIKNWNAYHFVGDTLRNGDPVPANGVTLKWTGHLEFCRSGYHASRKVWQALEFAPGNTLCRVHCGGEMLTAPDKIVCRERTIIDRIDAEQVLRAFARKCAADVLHLWDAPDVVVEYLRTGDESMRAAARDAAWAAARATRAAWDARAAARDAARAAAWDAWDAARDAARAKQRRRLTGMVNAAFEAQS